MGRQIKITALQPPKKGSGPVQPVQTSINAPDISQEPVPHFSDIEPTPRRGRPPKAPRAKEGGRDMYIPGMPTNGLDLMALWELPKEAYEGGRLKIMRRKYASLELELIHESDVAGFNLSNLAREFGPGDYHIQLSSDRQQLWRAKNCKCSVSAQYAASMGYQDFAKQPVATVSRISEARALQATAGALDGSRPITIGDLASLVEMVADKTAQAMNRAAPAPTQPPMGIDAMLMFWKAMNEMTTAAEDRTLKLAGMFMNGKVTAPDEEKPEPGFMDGILKSLPALLEIFVKPAQVQTQTVATPAIRTEPAPEPPPAPVEAPVQVPMTEEEMKPFAAAIFMLRPFVTMIVDGLKAGHSIPDLAKEFADYVPWKLEDAVIELAKITRERGPNVLGIISAQLQTPQAAQLMQEIASIIEAERQP